MKIRLKIYLKTHIKLIIGIVVGMTIPMCVYGATILFDSEDVSYNPTTSGLKDANGNDATTVQDAIDALKVKAQQKPSLKVGDYVTVVPDNSTYTIAGSQTGYTTKGAPYSESSSTASQTWKSNSYYCCSSTKPTLDTSTGKYTEMTTRTQGSEISGKFCIYSSSSRSYCSTTSYNQSNTIYNLNKNASSTSGTSISCTEYTSVASDALTDQTITPNELTLWRIININNDGTYDAVSEYVSSKVVYFQGTIGYANFVGGLQTAAAGYAKEGYTVGTRMIGYDGQTLTISDTSVFSGSATAPSTTNTPSPTTGTGEEYSGGVLGDTLYLKDYLLVQNVYQADNNTTKYCSSGLCAYKVGTQTITNYWLASRYYKYGSNTTTFSFYGRYIYTSGIVATGYPLRDRRSAWYDNPSSYNLRPIITLKSEVTISKGNGNRLSPYILN